MDLKTHNLNIDQLYYVIDSLLQSTSSYNLVSGSSSNHIITSTNFSFRKQQAVVLTNPLNHLSTKIKYSITVGSHV